MKEQGQVFSLDMLFALTLTALIVSYSGLALEQARRQAEEYQFRFSLERIANDAADVLVETAGMPENWEENIQALESPGLAEADRGGSLRNMLSIIKLGWLRDLCRSANWVDPQNENAVKALKALFGGSEHFEINIYGEDGERRWSIWPGWDVPGVLSGSENSIDVAVVRRAMIMKSFAQTREEAKGLQHLVAEPGGKDYFLDFLVNPGELDVFDWYVWLIPSGRNKPSVKIWVNRSTGSSDYDFPPALDNNIYKLHYHGAKAPDVKNPLTDVENGGNPNNYMRVRVTGNPSEWVDVFIVILPRCSPTEYAVSAAENLVLTLQVKLWR